MLKSAWLYLRSVITHLWTIIWSPAQATVPGKFVPQDASRSVASSATVTVVLLISIKTLNALQAAIQGMPGELVTPAQIEEWGWWIGAVTFIVQWIVRRRQGAVKPPGA